MSEACPAHALTNVILSTSMNLETKVFTHSNMSHTGVELNKLASQTAHQLTLSTLAPEQSTLRTQCIPLPNGILLAHVQAEVLAVFNSCPGFAVGEVLFWLLLFLKCECVCARMREYVCVCAHVCEGWRTILSAIFRNAVYLILGRFSPCSTAHQLCHTGWPISPRHPPASASPK